MICEENDTFHKVVKAVDQKRCEHTLKNDIVCYKYVFFHLLRLLCYHYGLGIMPGVFLDRMGDVLTCLHSYFITLSCFMFQNIQEYIQSWYSNDDRHQNNMHTVWIPVCIIPVCMNTKFTCTVPYSIHM